jgi:hypothetical protein
LLVSRRSVRICSFLAPRIRLKSSATHPFPIYEMGSSLINVDGTCTRGMSLANMTGVQIEDVHVIGCKGPLLTKTNVQGTGLEAP